MTPKKVRAHSRRQVGPNAKVDVQNRPTYLEFKFSMKETLEAIKVYKNEVRHIVHISRQSMIMIGKDQSFFRLWRCALSQLWEMCPIVIVPIFFCDFSASL